MTTKPRAKKFRIRRSATQGSAALADQTEPVEAPEALGDGGADPATATLPETTEAAAPAPAAAAPSEGTEAGTSDRSARREARMARSRERRARLAAVDGAPIPTSPEESTDGLSNMAEAAPAAASAAPATSAAPASMPASSGASPEQEIAQIRQEGLTGRQLRMARRMAQKHGLNATSDYDAVRLLRTQGLDPFRRSNMLEIVAPEDGLPATSNANAQLPQTRPAGDANLPSPDLASPAERRVREIGDIQRDIVRRRRRKTLLMFSRLAAFVALPTLLAGWYYYNVATPMYSSESVFRIIKSESTAAGPASLFSGTPLEGNQDSISTQDYLHSKQAMLRLDTDVGFKEVFADQTIDPLQRLAENPSNEQAYKIYKKFVKIGYDPTEGLIRMTVTAPDPGTSVRFSEALISYAEQEVDAQSQRKREDQMKDARRSLELAQADRRLAQEALVKLQEDTVLDPEGVIASLRSQISTYEIELQEKQLELTQLLENSRPNEARVDAARNSVFRLQNVLQALQERMTAAKEGEDSLASKTSRIQIAQADLATADLMMQTALQTLKQTELEASRQVLYLTTAVSPVAAEDPTYPRKFENTILAFLVFSGIYLMISLTGSILREQVSS